MRWQLHRDSCRPPLGLWPALASPVLSEEACLAAALSCHSTSVVVVPSAGKHAKRQQMMYLTEHSGERLGSRQQV